MQRKNKQRLRDIIQTELELYKKAFDRKDFDLAFKHLERVHIISQPFPWPHTRIHLKMLQFAIRTFRPMEIIVQFLFSLFSAKASALNLFPKGNTGGANAIFKGKMEIPNDLKNEVA